MITWFNSPYQGHQTSQTVESMVMVGQWYRRHDEVSFDLYLFLCMFSLFYRHQKWCPLLENILWLSFSTSTRLTWSFSSSLIPNPTCNLGDSSDKSEDNEEDEEKQSKGEKEAQMPKKRGCKKWVISSASCMVVDENEINLVSSALLAMISDELQTLCDTPESAMASGSSQLLFSEEVNRRDVPVNWESLGI